MLLPANISHIIAVIVAIAFSVFTVLKVQPEFQGVAWIGAVAAVLAILKTVFTDTPAVAAQKAAAKRLGVSTIAVDPAKGVVA